LVLLCIKKLIIYFRKGVISWEGTRRLNESGKLKEDGSEEKKEKNWLPKPAKRQRSLLKPENLRL
jgi:hypothetical protein